MTVSRGRLLFIGYDYHAYTRAIGREFEALGYTTRFHSIQPGFPHFKLARRLSATGYQRLLDRYHRRIIRDVPERSLDEVMFLQVHQVSHANLQDLRDRQPQARFTLYNWDAVSTHDYRDRLSFFNRAFTFDRLDAETLGIDYLPLFCLRDFQHLSPSPASSRAYFVGNIVNPKRYEAVRAFEAWCAGNGVGFQAHMATTVHGYTEMRRAGIRPRGVTFRSLPQQDFIRMIEGSHAAFDFANHRQTGFTMRTMENLCAGRKIITNNREILKAPFYSPDRIHLFEDFDFSGVRHFLEVPLERPKEDFAVYHVQSFASRLLGL